MLKIMITLVLVAMGHMANAKCKAGDVDFNFSTGEYRGDREITEVRYCNANNGTFMTDAEYKKYWEAQNKQPWKCKAGDVDFNFSTGEYRGDREITEVRKCNTKNGTFMTDLEYAKHRAHIANSKKPCVEGNVRIVENSFGSELYKETLKCIAGRYKVIEREFIRNIK